MKYKITVLMNNTFNPQLIRARETGIPLVCTNMCITFRDDALGSFVHSDKPCNRNPPEMGFATDEFYLKRKRNAHYQIFRRFDNTIKLPSNAMLFEFETHALCTRGDSTAFSEAMLTGNKTVR